MPNIRAISMLPLFILVVGVISLSVWSGGPRIQAGAPQNKDVAERCDSSKDSVELGNKLVVFKGPVYSPVTIERIANPFKDWKPTGHGSELDEATTPLRPGETYHVWVRLTNHSGIDRSQALNFQLIEKGTSHSLSLMSQGTVRDGISMWVLRHETDAKTRVTAGTFGAFEPLFNNVQGHVFILAGGSEVLLVTFALGENIPPGNLQFVMNLLSAPVNQE